MSKNSRVVWCIVALFALLCTTAVAQSVLEKLPYSGDVLVSRAIRAGRIQLPNGSANVGTNPQLTCSPAPCVFTPTQASPGTNIADENPIVANPTNAMNLLTGANDYSCQSTSFVGTYASTDGGTTWTRKCLPGSGGEGDPIVGFDTTGVAYAGGIQNGSVVLASSTNGGITFGTPKQVINAKLGYLADKPWLEVDTNSGSSRKNALYVSTTQFASNSNSQIWVSHSTDGGNTWTSTAVDTIQVFPNAVDQFSDLAVGSDGTVYVDWIRCPANGPSGDCGGTSTPIMFSKSTDGGNTWSTATTVTTAKLTPDPNFCCFYGALPVTNFERVSNVPSNAASGSSSTATVYVTYYNYTGTQMQVNVIKSSDGGSTWGTPARVTTSTKGDEFFPWINLASNGRKLAATWLDRRNDSTNTKYQPFFATSNNGSSWSASHALSSKQSNPNNDGFGGGFMGDYRTHVWSGFAVDASWMDTTFTNVNCQDAVGGVQLK